MLCTTAINTDCTDRTPLQLGTVETTTEKLPSVEDRGQTDCITILVNKPKSSTLTYSFDDRQLNCIENILVNALVGKVKVCYKVPEGSSPISRVAVPGFLHNTV